MKRLTFILPIFFLSLVHGQQFQPDFEKKLDFLYNLSSINLDEALLETEKMLSNYKNDHLKLTRVYLLYVKLQSGMGNYTEAIKNCNTAIAISQKTTPELIINFKSVLASCYAGLSEYELALNLYDEVLNSNETKSNPYLELSTKISLATFNTKISRNREALKIYFSIVNNPEHVKNNQVLAATTILDIADSYISLEQQDSTQYYLDFFEREFASNVPEIVSYMELRVLGNLDYANGNYVKAINNFNPYLKKYESFFNQTDVETTLRKGESWFGLNMIDSVYTTLQKIAGLDNVQEDLSFKDLSSYYKLAANVYREKGLSKEANAFFQKFVKAESEYNSLKFLAQEGIHDIQTKELLARGRQQEVRYQRYIVWISGILGMLLVCGIFYYWYTYKKNQERFGNLIAKVQSYEKSKLEEGKKSQLTLASQLPKEVERSRINAQPDIIADDKIKDISGENENEILDQVSESNYNLKDEKIEEVLNKLEKLKQSDFFLRQDSSLYNTAKKLKTNTSYLSSIINNTMNMNFNRYVNDIRMEYIILELKNNKRMRSYSVRGIAEEIGYKSADSFSKYFKESTGLTPSAYIKKLNKEFKV